MDFESLQVFLEIYNTHSISGAANILFLSQSTVSRKLLLLEQSLGIELFVRSKGHNLVVLTTAGERFLKMAKAMLELQQEAIHLKEYSQKVSLFVAGVDSINAYILPRFYQQLLHDHPNLELTLATHHSWEIHDLLESRAADIGIVNNESPFSDISSELLFQEDYVVVRKGPDPMDGIEYIHPSQLDPEHEIYQGFSLDYSRWHNYWWKPSQAKIKVNIALLTECFFESPKDWTILPYSVAYVLQQRGFRLTKLSDPPPKRSCYLAMQKKLRANNAQIIKDFSLQLNTYLQTYFNNRFESTDQ